MKNKYSFYDVLLLMITMLVCLFIVLPLVIVVIMSFNAVSYSVFPPESFSFTWYRNLVEQPQFLTAFFNSVFTSFSATVLALFAGILAVIGLERYTFPGRNLLRAFYMSPVVIPKITLGIAFLIYFSQLNVPGGLFSLIIAETIAIFPFVLAIVGGAYAQINKVYEAAASDLGAKPFYIFCTVTLPQLKGAIILSGIIAFIFTFDQVELALMLLRPQNYTLPVELFVYMEKWQDPTIAVISTLMMLLAVIVFFGLRIVVRNLPVVKKII